MSERIALIARIGAAIPGADEATQAVLRDALTALVEDHALVAHDERRKRKDRERKLSRESVESKESAESVDVSPSPLPSSSFPTPHITTSFPPTPSPHLPAPKVIRVVPTPSPDVEVVMAHYRTTHPKRRPGAKDGRAVVKALGWGFTAEELCAAITGNAEDEWHAGKHKHDLPYVLRDSGQIDNFREKGKPLAMTDLWDYERGELTPLGERLTRPAVA